MRSRVMLVAALSWVSAGGPSLTAQRGTGPRRSRRRRFTSTTTSGSRCATVTSVRRRLSPEGRRARAGDPGAHALRQRRRRRTWPPGSTGRLAATPTWCRTCAAAASRTVSSIRSSPKGTTASTRSSGWPCSRGHGPGGHDGRVVPRMGPAVRRHSEAPRAEGAHPHGHAARPRSQLPRPVRRLRTVHALVAGHDVRQDHAGHLRTRPAGGLQPSAALRGRPAPGPDAAACGATGSITPRATRTGRPRASSARSRTSTIPMLHISGWYDDVLVGTTENYAITRDKPNQFLLIGPWGHRINQGRRIGAIDFGPEAVMDLERRLRALVRSMAEGDPERRRVRTRRSATS